MKKIINGKILIALFVFTNAIYLTMILWSLPTLMEYAGGLKAFDMRPAGYNFSDATTLLRNLGNDGLNFYKNTQLLLDTFYPFGFILTYAIGCLWVFEKLDSLKFLGKSGALASVIAGIADYIENFFIFQLIEVNPQITEDLVSKANISTLVKSISTTIAMSIFILSFLVLGFSTLIKNLKRE